MKVESQKINSTDSVFTHSVFKSHAVVSNTNSRNILAAATGLTTSKHLVTDTSIYTESYQDFLSFMET
jgi:hypothetical protein